MTWSRNIGYVRAGQVRSCCSWARNWSMGESPTDSACQSCCRLIKSGAVTAWPSHFREVHYALYLGQGQRIR